MKTVVLAMGLALAAGAAQAEIRKAVVAGGCFWCVESDFEAVKGVQDVVSGFAGGKGENPTYKEVSRGDTGHYEVVQITYDDAVLPYADLVARFLRSIDVTDAGGQFCDRGDTYRTAIFVSDAAEKAVAEAAVTQAGQQLGQAIATKVLPAAPFWPAEDYHQGYYQSSDIVLTRGGPMQKKNAYTFYREGCGRDARLKALWGKDAWSAH